jgi:metal-responsive CopG/Arc/MetJ family transcriptional regulator
MPARSKVPVPYEIVNVKLPLGLHSELADVLTREQRWPSRQDFIIDAVREKLDRMRPEGLSRESRGRPRAQTR